MPRISVYIPDDLFKQMEQSGGGLNFSMIAQHAIQEAVTKVSTQGRGPMNAHLLDVPTRGDYRLFEVPLPGRPYRVKVSGTTLALGVMTQPIDAIVAEFAKRQIRHGAELEDGNVFRNSLASSEAQAIDAYLAGRARGLEYACTVRVTGFVPGTKSAVETYHVGLSCDALGPGPGQVYGIDVVLPFMPGSHKWQELEREERRRCIESAARAHIYKFGLPLAWGYEGGKHVIHLTKHPANPEPGDPGEPFTMRE